MTITSGRTKESGKMSKSIQERWPKVQPRKKGIRICKVMICLVKLKLKTDKICVADMEGSGSVRITSRYDPDYRITSELYTVANQLQFACRQLHQESRGLSLKYNKIIFSVPNWRSMHIWNKAIALCVGFLSIVSPSAVQDITTLAIKVNSKLRWEDNQREALAVFCRANPAAQIHMHEGRSSQPEHMADLALGFHRMTGRYSSFLGKRGVSVSPCDLTMPENFRLRFGYGAVDMGVLQKRLSSNRYTGARFAYALDDDLGDLAAFVSAFTEVGF